MSKLYNEGYDLFERKPELTEAELDAHALAHAGTEGVQKFRYGYSAAYLKSILNKGGLYDVSDNQSIKDIEG